MRRRGRATGLISAGVLLLMVISGGDALSQTSSAGSAAEPQVPGVAPIPLYRQHCARCHGEEGAGDGSHAAFLRPAPASFTAGRFKLKTTRPGTPPSIDNVVRTIRRGVRGTSMPAFEGILEEAEIGALAAYVFTLTGRTPSRRSMRVASVPDLGPNAVVQGKRLYERLGCAECHGEEGLGDGPAVPRLRNEDGSQVSAPDLTRPWNFKGGWERIDIALRVLSGMEGTPMPGYREESLRADQLYALVDYVLSLRRAPDLQGSIILDAEQELRDGESMVSFGERLVAMLSCARCHTPVDENALPRRSLHLAGGRRIELYPLRRLVSSNLTPHATGIEGVTADGLRQTLRTGRTPDGRNLDQIGMPWPHFAALSDVEIDAIHAYLISLPPVANEIPTTESMVGLDPLLFKIQALTGGKTIHWISHQGNAGDPAGSGRKVEPVPDRIWVKVAMAMGVVLLLEILYLWRPLMFTGLRRRRHRRTMRERLRGPVLVLSVLVMGAVIALAWWPLHGFSTPDGTIERLAPAVPGPVGITGQTAAIAARGRHLVEIAACAGCHTSMNPLLSKGRGPSLAGGPRFSWSVFGEVTASNLTPDDETGIGKLSSTELKQVLRSGLRTDWQIHPAGMPWDLLSRMTEEEIESVVTYLESIPAVRHRVPPRRPEGGGGVYTIHFEPE